MERSFVCADLPETTLIWTEFVGYQKLQLSY